VADKTTKQDQLRAFREGKVSKEDARRKLAKALGRELTIKPAKKGKKR
jgi:hypothetical protein